MLAAVVVFVGYQYVRIFLTGGAWTNDGPYAGAYGTVDSKGTVVLMAFLPGTKDFFTVLSQGESSCYQLGTIYGDIPRKAVWRLWYSDLGSFGWMVDKEGYEPIVFEYFPEVSIGDGCESLPRDGAHDFFRGDFNGEQMLVAHMVLDRDDTFDPELFEPILTSLRGKAREKGRPR